MTDGESRDPVWPGQYGGMPYPRCENYEIHGPHPYPVPGLRSEPCRGWTASEQSVRTLIISVRKYLRDNWPAAGPPLYGDLPAGLRLEMHPQALRDFTYITGIHSDLMASRFGLRAKVNPDLPAGSWRLVIVTENVLLEGKAADDPR